MLFSSLNLANFKYFVRTEQRKNPASLGLVLIFHTLEKSQPSTYKMINVTADFLFHFFVLFKSSHSKLVTVFFWTGGSGWGGGGGGGGRG